MTKPTDARFYGRRHGRPLRPARRKLMAELLPRLRLHCPVQAEPAAPPLDPSIIFAPRRGRVWLEIGFGDGEHLAWQAAANPNVGFIGAEPFVNGVAALLARLDEQGLENVRILDDDVRPLLQVLAPAGLERVFILFPDPWPKARHRRRRIVNDRCLADLARLIRPGGELRLATDDRDYARWMLRHMQQRPEFRWLARRPQDWRQQPSDTPPTRYERKGTTAGRPGIFLNYERL
ncbi:MAG: tRNA (guanosine(46)-N7)-methyltransferase TrmB [Alphaproteobacteria bacterium]